MTSSGNKYHIAITFCGQKFHESLNCRDFAKMNFADVIIRKNCKMVLKLPIGQFVIEKWRQIASCLVKKQSFNLIATRYF